MNEVIKKYWWILAISGTIIAPVGLNFILQFNVTDKIIGYDTDWLSFWSSYLGAIIGAIVSFIILNKTITENRKARDEQFRVILSQLSINRIENYKNAIQIVLDAFCTHNIDKLVESVQKRQGSAVYDKIIDDILVCCNKANNSFRLAFDTELDNFEKKYIETFEYMRRIYFDVIRDIHFIVTCSPELDEYDYPIRESLLGIIEEYKKKCKSPYSDIHRVWSVACSSHFSIEFTNFPDGIIERLRYYVRSEMFYQESIKFIQYENKKAKEILYGTEQDK